jgi:hypothetical protein
MRYRHTREFREIDDMIKSLEVEMRYRHTREFREIDDMIKNAARLAGVLRIKSAVKDFRKWVLAQPDLDVRMNPNQIRAWFEKWDRPQSKTFKFVA